MNEHSDAQVAAEFLGYHRLALDSQDILQRQGEEWASDYLSNLVDEDPGRCWRIIGLIAHLQPNDEVMMHLAIKVASLLLACPAMIDAICEQAREDRAIRELLSWIDEDDVERVGPAIWGQIEALSK